MLMGSSIFVREMIIINFSATLLLCHENVKKKLRFLPNIGLLLANSVFFVITTALVFAEGCGTGA